MQEVLRRQDQTNFDKSNVWTVGVNAAAILVSFVAPALLYHL